MMADERALAPAILAADQLDHFHPPPRRSWAANTNGRPRRRPAAEGQLELTPLPAESRTLPLGARVCSLCDRRGYVVVARGWRCDWHATASLPADVRRRSRSR